MNTEPTDIDAELLEVKHRRACAMDLLVRSLIEIDTLTYRIDVLLDRRACAPDQMT